MALNYFLLYLFSILVVRVWLRLFPKHGPIIGKFRPHHYAYGLVLIALSFFIFQPILLAIGLALFVDEIPLFFIFKGWNWPDNHWKQYNSWISITGVAVLSLIGFVLLYFF